jgi:hypothetical protein
MTRNRGSEAATVTYVHEGTEGQVTVTPGGVYYLPYQVNYGKKVSEVYDSLTAYFPTSEKTVTYDVEQTVRDSLVIFEFTNAESPLNTSIVTMHNASSYEFVLEYELNGATTTIDMDPNGSYDLPEPITNGGTLGDVYSAIYATIDGTQVYTADLTTVVNDDVAIDVVPDIPPVVGFILNLPESSIPVRPTAWNAAGSDSAGSVTFSPYLSAETYGDVFNGIFAAVQGGTIDSVDINQGESSWTMDEFTIDGSTINMTDSVSGETFSLEGGGWIDDYNSIIISSYTIGITVGEEPSASSDLVIVLDNPVESTTPSYLIDTLTATANVFLIQWHQQTYYENIDFTKSVTAGETAALTFALGNSEDPDYQEITVNYTWDSDSSLWQYDSHTQTGFNGIVFND